MWSSFGNGPKRIKASREPALLATLMEVTPQVPVVTPPGMHLMVTATDTMGTLDGGAVIAVACQPSPPSMTPWHRHVNIQNPQIVRTSPL
jgi:hypothetical protein